MLDFYVVFLLQIKILALVFFDILYIVWEYACWFVCVSLSIPIIPGVFRLFISIIFYICVCYSFLCLWICMHVACGSGCVLRLCIARIFQLNKWTISPFPFPIFLTPKVFEWGVETILHSLSWGLKIGPCFRESRVQ